MNTFLAREARMPIALVLIVLGVFSRLIPHPPNFVALGAIALFAGAKLPKRFAFIVPLAIMVLSDAIIDSFTRSGGFHYPLSTRLTGYAVFTMVVALGQWNAAKTGPLGLVGKSLAASSLFFLISNFEVWLAGDGLGMPKTMPGLISNYVGALPFFKNTLSADLIGTAVLFGADALISLGLRSKSPVDELA
jgi:hypothetical protein